VIRFLLWNLVQTCLCFLRDSTKASK
jgi:hypothetical protein